MRTQEVNSLALSFGLCLRTARIAKQWSQDAFAERVGTHRTEISSIERGLREPRFAMIVKYASVLETDVERPLLHQLALPTHDQAPEGRLREDRARPVAEMTRTIPVSGQEAANGID